MNPSFSIPTHSALPVGSSLGFPNRIDNYATVSSWIPGNALPSTSPYSAAPSGPTKPMILKASVTKQAGAWDKPEAGQSIHWKNLAQAIGFYALAAATHRLKLPQRLPKDGLKTILPSDWKIWTRVVLGVQAVQQLNKGFELKLPPWLGALETIAVVNPLVLAGIPSLSRKEGLIQTAVMAPVVMGVVQLTSMISKALQAPAQQKWQIPPSVTQLGLSLGFGILSLVAYPSFYRTIAKSGIIGQELKAKAESSASSFATATISSCPKGCSPGSFICLSELADVGGSFWTWLQDRLSGKTQTNQSKPASGKSVSLNPGAWFA